MAFYSLMNTPLMTALPSNWKRTCFYVAYSSQISYTGLSRTILYIVYQRSRNSRDSLYFKASKTITRKKEQNSTTLITFV